MIGMLFAAAAVAASQPAGDWPHWRGPRADGTAPAADPPLTWDATKNVRWKAALPGRGSASPIVWGDQVFVLSAAETGREATAADLPKADPRFEERTRPPKKFFRFVISSFDRSTGAKRWERVAAEAVPHEGHHETHTYAGGSPTADGERVYACFGSFGTFAFGLDGTPVWSRDLGRLHTRLGWGEAVTPVVYKGALLLNRDQEADSKLVCLDAATGTTRWEAARDEKSTWNTPLVVERPGGPVVVVNGTNRVRAYELATGKEVWAVGGMTVNPIPSAVTDGETVYVMSGYRGSAAVAVPLTAVGDLGTKTGVLWRYGKGTPYVPSPLLLDGRLYFTQANGEKLTVLDAKTGRVVIDEERLPGASQFYASPVAAPGRVYLVDRKGTTVVLKAGTDAVEVLATNKLNDPVDATPALAGKQLFLRATTNLYCIEQR
jgi:outer membrane protein assembly factor BamB